MARGRRTTWPKNQGFTKSQYELVEAGICKLRDQAVVGVKPNNIKCDELIHMFVPEEHHQVCRQAVEVMGLNPVGLGVIEWYTFDPTRPDRTSKAPICLNFYPNRKLDWAPPSYLGKKNVNMDHPAAVHALAWAKWRIERGREWSLVRAVFMSLHEKLNNIQQVRFYWPALVPLMATISPEAADDIRTMKPPSSLPPLPPALKEACINTQYTITKSLLLPDDKKPIAPGDEFYLTVDMNYYPGKTPWDGTQMFAM